VLLKPLPLPPVLKVGNLNVSTIPGNAEIYLNGSDKGATPANSANGKLLAGLPVGQYELQLTKPGYHIAIIKVANNMTKDVRIFLQAFTGSILEHSMFPLFPRGNPVYEQFEQGYYPPIHNRTPGRAHTS
jgi:hypothetical protein